VEGVLQKSQEVYKVAPMHALDINVTGLIQGVGFRPFIYKLAREFGITGWVKNRNDCVQIKAQGNPDTLEGFVASIKDRAPNIARVVSITTSPAPLENFSEFQIVISKNTSSSVTEISPDLSVCDDCLADMKRQPNRHDYPFVNCTNCGPRFSIIRDLPYDRGKTTMSAFQMCPSCQSEYDDPTNRRFHAQPNACNDCGPQLGLMLTKGESPCKDNSESVTDIMSAAARILANGGLLAIKGIGGFHLACDATNEEAVKRLREGKSREGKPFAVMMPNLETVRQYTEVNHQEETLLLSNKRPVVILPLYTHHPSPITHHLIAPSVTQGLRTLGVMLPYTPLHHLLFKGLPIPAIVLTSGNISDEPIVIDNEHAVETLGQIADAVLVYNRDIHNRNDDSVVTVINTTSRIIRRSRGYAPEPITLNMDVDGIIATGAELKNTFCIGKGHQAILSQHIGDLKNLETFEFYQEALTRFQKLFRLNNTPVTDYSSLITHHSSPIIVHDLHPDYLSTKFAKESGLPTIAIQHHHAHIASCMAEHGLDESVIGFSFDGSGYGDDGTIWGGEVFVCDLSDYQRVAHFEPIPMPGGEKSIKEPWRMAVSYLYQAYGKSFIDLDIPFVDTVETLPLLLSAIDKKINAPLTSSAGRLFDAVSVLLGICGTTSFEAEAAIRLELLAAKNIEKEYPYHIEPIEKQATQDPTQEPKNSRTQNCIISVQPMIKTIASDIQSGIDPAIISVKFHNTIVAIMVDMAEHIRKEKGLNKVALSGGLFQNRYILTKAEQQLAKNQFDVYAHSKVPTNDGGIALGQLAIAAKRRNLEIG